MKREELIRGIRESQLVYELSAVSDPATNLPLGEGKLAYRIAGYILDNRDLFIGILNDDQIREEFAAELED